ncbi:MAG: NAD-glutamate dehydrogenase [Alphaproteobacteria bacterium]|nr:MAG: NAD-glutamate dehydrogenase [Alphaproteobacteria bacterium]
MNVFNKELLADMPSLGPYIDEDILDEINRLATQLCNRWGFRVCVQNTPHDTRIILMAQESALLISTMHVVLEERKITPCVFSYARFCVPRTGKESDVYAISYNATADRKTFTTEVLAVFVFPQEFAFDAFVSILKERLILLHEINSSLAHVTTLINDSVPIHSHGKRYLGWLLNGHFSFFGCAFTDKRATQGKDACGLLASGGYTLQSLLKGVSQKKRSDVLISQKEIVFAKSSCKSPVHRFLPMDLIFVPLVKNQDQPCEYLVIVGLYTSEAYTVGTRYIPYISDNISRVITRLGLGEGWHDGKWLHHMYDSFPRDEIFQSDITTLMHIGQGILEAKTNHNFGVIVTQDPFKRYTNIVILIPGPNFDTTLFEALSAYLAQKLSRRTELVNAAVYSYALAFAHYRVYTNDLARRDIQPEIMDFLTRWQDKILLLLQANPHNKADYQRILPRGYPTTYQVNNSPAEGVLDLDYVLGMNAGEKRCRVRIWRRDKRVWGIKVYTLHEGLLLTKIVSNLVNFGLEVSRESVYRIETIAGVDLWIHDLYASCASDTCAVGEVTARNLTDALERRWSGQLGDSVANLALLRLNVTWRECFLVTCFLQYMKQLGFAYAPESLARIITCHGSIMGRILDLFKAHHDSTLAHTLADRRTIGRLIFEEILVDLDGMRDSEAEQWLRGLVLVVWATVRTNFYRDFYQKSAGEHIALKISSEKLPFLQTPPPFCEIFVYSNSFEGVHVRGGKVSRGGIRWSDRGEDYRTEVYGLFKAQMVKNAVIVPVGAKGVFYVRAGRSDFARPDMYKTHGVCCYKSFVRALIDITDNSVDKKIVHPHGIVCFDDPDPYLVIAADKGTAAFSDYANDISRKQGFWLGDAFASGGKNGYEHKKLGITAKGAWVSVSHHLKTLGIDEQTDALSVVGVGDMSGDVFGNGMLISPRIALVAAFDHRHIFLDPKPDLKRSYAERARLFSLKQSSWEDYNANTLSKGGGIFSRDSKHIPVTVEMRLLLDLPTTMTEIKPDDLIRAILSARVDLLWLGGVGTFVCASFETSDTVNDTTNNAVRVFANTLRCRIIGEGANLGITQQGRIEFSRLGGLLNTDSIDNSAGVNCSDYEVNLKILLGHAQAAGKISVSQRNALLRKMTQDVVACVLKNNHNQNLLLSRMQREVKMNPTRIQLLITYLESKKIIQAGRELSRDYSLISMTRPELSLVVAHAKNLWIMHGLENDFDHKAFKTVLYQYFPAILVTKYSAEIDNHPLAPNIILTELINTLINTMGLGFLPIVMRESEQSLLRCVRAWFVLHQNFLHTEFLEDVHYATVMQIACVYLLNTSTRGSVCLDDDDLAICMQNLRLSSAIADIPAAMIFLGLTIYMGVHCRRKIVDTEKFADALASETLRSVVSMLIPEPSASLAEHTLFSHELCLVMNACGACFSKGYGLQPPDHQEIPENSADLTCAERVVYARAYVNALTAAMTTPID